MGKNSGKLNEIFYKSCRNEYNEGVINAKLSGIDSPNFHVLHTNPHIKVTAEVTKSPKLKSFVFINLSTV